jgi:tRNA(Ile)-lysidine synthase
LKQLKTFPNQKAILYQLLKDYGFTQWQDVYNLIEAQTGKQVFSKSHYLLKDREFLVLGVVEETKDKRQESRGKSQETRVTRFSKGVPSLRGGTTWQTYDVTQILNIKNLDKNQESRDKTQEVVFKELDIIKLDSESVLEFKISFLKRTKALNFKSNLLNEAYFDASKIKLPLFVRKWQFGDYFYPLGMQGKKKLSDFLIDQKVSNLEKKKIWLLCDAQDQIIWVIGKRLDNRYKITDTTTEIFKITKTND